MDHWSFNVPNIKGPVVASGQIIDDLLMTLRSTFFRLAQIKVKYIEVHLKSSDSWFIYLLVYIFIELLRLCDISPLLSSHRRFGKQTLRRPRALVNSSLSPDNCA